MLFLLFVLYFQAIFSFQYDGNTVLFYRDPQCEDPRLDVCIMNATTASFTLQGATFKVHHSLIRKTLGVDTYTLCELDFYNPAEDDAGEVENDLELNFTVRTFYASCNVIEVPNSTLVLFARVYKHCHSNYVNETLNIIFGNDRIFRGFDDERFVFLYIVIILFLVAILVLTIGVLIECCCCLFQFFRRLRWRTIVQNTTQKLPRKSRGETLRVYLYNIFVNILLIIVLLFGENLEIFFPLISLSFYSQAITNDDYLFRLLLDEETKILLVLLLIAFFVYSLFFVLLRGFRYCTFLGSNSLKQLILYCNMKEYCLHRFVNIYCYLVLASVWGYFFFVDLPEFDEMTINIQIDMELDLALICIEFFFVMVTFAIKVVGLLIYDDVGCVKYCRKFREIYYFGQRGEEDAKTKPRFPNVRFKFLDLLFESPESLIREVIVMLQYLEDYDLKELEEDDETQHLKWEVMSSISVGDRNQLRKFFDLKGEENEVNDEYELDESKQLLLRNSAFARTSTENSSRRGGGGGVYGSGEGSGVKTNSFGGLDWDSLMYDPPFDVVKNVVEACWKGLKGCCSRRNRLIY